MENGAKDEFYFEINDLNIENQMELFILNPPLPIEQINIMY